MKRYITIIVLFLLPSGLYAQVKDTLVKPRILKQWNLSRDYSEEKIIPIDTAFSLFHRSRISDRFSPVNASLGNYGLPLYQISFFDRVTDPDRFLADYYYPYLHLPENAVFMNTQEPYTELDWTFAGPQATSEQAFRVRHSQNVNRFLNFGLIYDIVYSLGQYNYQRSEDKTFTFYNSYTGTKYKLYFSAGLNNIKSWENGGITDPAELSQLNTRDVKTNLGKLNLANSSFKNRNILLVQRYTIGVHKAAKADTTQHKKQGFLGLSGTFSHIFIFDYNARRYKDEYPASGFYDKILVTRNFTNDSIYARTIKNTLRFDFTTDETRKFSLGGGIGIRNEIIRYYNIIPVIFLTPGYASGWNKGNNVLLGKLYNSIGEKFRWAASGELYLTGYRAGDFDLNGEIDKSFDWKKGKSSWMITGSIVNQQPSYWFQHWGSNNFEWNNNLSKEFRINVGTGFSYPGRKFEAKFNYAIIKNYTDFDSTAMPSQYGAGLSVAAIYVKKELRAWKFHLMNEVIVQKSSNSRVLDLPLATVKSAGFFEHLFRFRSTGGKLYMQLGVDVTYNTPYHPYSYMPATGRFYRQENTTAGNYAYLNPFLNLKIKRTRLLIEFDHVNSGMMGYDYAMVPSYPMNIRMLRYGLSWTFYD